MNKIAVIIVLACVVVISMAADVWSYENPRYMEYHRKDGTIDTVGMLTCHSDPELMVPNTLDIEYYLPASAQDSVYIYLKSGQICDFNWDKLSHTWYGGFERGDTLRCSFGFTPLTVGTVAVIFRVEYGHKWDRGLTFWFTLDETGRIVPDERGSGEKKHGLFGPAPEVIGDSLFYVGQCYQTERDRRGREFCIQAKMSPALGPDVYSEILYTVVPTSGQDLGVFFRVSYNDLFEVILEDSTDWLHPVHAGDTMEVRILAKPVKPGIGELSLMVVGFTPLKEPTYEGGVDFGGRTKDWLGVTFAIDDNLHQIAYSTNADIPLRRPISAIHDAYRVPSIEALSVNKTRLEVVSEHWETRRKELDREFRELMK